MGWGSRGKGTQVSTTKAILHVELLSTASKGKYFTVTGNGRRKMKAQRIIQIFLARNRWEGVGCRKKERKPNFISLFLLQIAPSPS
ncbi:hypothetical protein IMZ48_06975 [Candidatus Bathyarchaeota archaeon]|nr:hypothetical protein [Candidatus Bathyarchaeota archaeon]